MLIRLLQSFSGIELDEAAQPADSRPPAEWKNATGRKAIERFWPKAHLTLHASESPLAPPSGAWAGGGLVTVLCFALCKSSVLWSCSLFQAPPSLLSCQ
jgi:hypothetical protein